MELKHHKCGGIVVVDVAGGFTLRTHSIMVTPTEVRLGVLELTAKPRGGETSYVCTKCEEQFDPNKDGLDNVTAMCLCCSKQKPVTELFMSFHFPAICSTCKDEITEGKGKKKSPMYDYIDLSKSSIQFVPVINVLKKPLR